MSESIDRIQAELESLGYDTFLFNGPRGAVVSFEYTIETGTHKGEQVKIGVSFQEVDYPEYSPHWVHVSPPIGDGKLGVIERHSDPDGRDWLAMSRPPGDFWDRLRTKHMYAFINEHLRRIWKDV